MQTEQGAPYLVHTYYDLQGKISTRIMPYESADIRKATERANKFWNLFTKYRGMKS